MPTFSLVTSFRGDHWNIYAKDCIESFIKHWPKDTKLYAYYNDWPERDYSHMTQTGLSLLI